MDLKLFVFCKNKTTETSEMHNLLSQVSIESLSNKILKVVDYQLMVYEVTEAYVICLLRL